MRPTELPCSACGPTELSCAPAELSCAPAELSCAPAELPCAPAELSCAPTVLLAFTRIWKLAGGLDRCAHAARGAARPLRKLRGSGEPTRTPASRAHRLPAGAPPACVFPRGVPGSAIPPRREFRRARRLRVSHTVLSPPSRGLHALSGEPTAYAVGYCLTLLRSCLAVRRSYLAQPAVQLSCLARLRGYLTLLRSCLAVLRSCLAQPAKLFSLYVSFGGTAHRLARPKLKFDAAEWLDVLPDRPCEIQRRRTLECTLQRKRSDSDALNGAGMFERAGQPACGTRKKTLPQVLGYLCSGASTGQRVRNKNMGRAAPPPAKAAPFVIC